MFSWAIDSRDREIEVGIDVSLNEELHERERDKGGTTMLMKAVHILEKPSQEEDCWCRWATGKRGISRLSSLVAIKAIDRNQVPFNIQRHMIVESIARGSHFVFGMLELPWAQVSANLTPLTASGTYFTLSL
ncbi:hypothetical protein DBV15_01121 [Temnothorax longispinosus]|uniref:Uncharacterized protein n=1 Tax=Temnothorax longispinosus TaxID=300112 RepID=A0A4S2J9Z7_9HYME|nr:hypothetical protein DBV15_01121 [Temnothorax longispinosus]